MNKSCISRFEIQFKIHGIGISIDYWISQNDQTLKLIIKKL